MRCDAMQFNAIRYEILICIAILIAVSSFFKNDVWRAVCDVILYHTVCCVMIRGGAVQCAVMRYEVVRCSAVWCVLYCQRQRDLGRRMNQSVSQSVDRSACLSCVTNSTI